MLVAIKIVEAELDTGAEEDGARESLLSASISHPNVVVSPVELVYDLAFILIPGRCLAARRRAPKSCCDLSVSLTPMR